MQRLLQTFYFTCNQSINNDRTLRTLRRQSTKGTMDPGVRATVVTAGHCTHAELTSGLAAGMLWLAVRADACTPAVYAN